MTRNSIAAALLGVWLAAPAFAQDKAMTRERGVRC
jgi:hypothetical protein